MWERTHAQARAPTSVNLCTLTLACACTHREGRGGRDSDSREAERRKDLLSTSPNQAGIVAALVSFSMIQRLLSMSGWGFHWLFHTLLEEEKRKKQIKFQFPSIALDLCNQLSL